MSLETEHKKEEKYTFEIHTKEAFLYTPTRSFTTCQGSSNHIIVPHKKDREESDSYLSRQMKNVPLPAVS